MGEMGENRGGVGGKGIQRYPMCMQVLEAAVIAIPHPKWTERPLLVVVSAEGSKLTKEDMLNFLQVLHKIAWFFRSCICFCS